MKALGIIGYHHTGKTTLATFIISRLWEKGFKVNSIKDIHNEAYRADVEGSNSWKHAKAGASRVLAIGTKDAALVMTPQPDLKSALPLFDCDWLIIEGMKHAAVPKIVCAVSEDQLEELVDDSCIGISGPIATSMSHYKGLPCFCLQRDAVLLMDTVLAKAFPILPQRPGVLLRLRIRLQHHGLQNCAGPGQPRRLRFGCFPGSSALCKRPPDQHSAFRAKHHPGYRQSPGGQP